MKKLNFKDENEFLSALDGKVYAISNGDGNYLCDVLEDDYLKLLDAGMCVNLDNTDYVPSVSMKEDNYSQYILTQTLNPSEKIIFKERFGVEIIINGE